MDLRVNGDALSVEVEPQRNLLSVLRDDLHLTGAKYGCGEGQCGSCTVLVDGVPVRSCTVTVASVAGREIVTIEGLAEGDKLHPVQEAFVQAGAMQCGYCTPGMIMSVVGLLRSNPNPSVGDILRHMDGNICRCGTYQRIITAIQNAAASMEGATP